jgi:N-glycosylase/DNA lyase
MPWPSAPVGEKRWKPVVQPRPPEYESIATRFSRKRVADHIILEVDGGAIEAISPLVLEREIPLEDPGPLISLRVGAYALSLRWGQPHLLSTCAFWIDQTRQRGRSSSYRLGQDLSEEVVACLLGGFGVPAEVGLGAFKALREEGLIGASPPPTPGQIEAVLCGPIAVLGRRHPSRYRYPRQRAERISTALRLLAEGDIPSSPLALRDWLVQIPGVGPKTASWVVRNHTGADCVAIIDIHVQRAGLAAGFFDDSWRLPRDYELFERSFLAIARLGGVSAAALDACIWGQLHSLGRAAAVVLAAARPGEQRQRTGGRYLSR